MKQTVRFFLWSMLVPVVAASASPDRLQASAAQLMHNKAMAMKAPARQVPESALTPVSVKVTVGKADWNQTISLCNTSTSVIPLKNITFSFGFGGTISSIWGNPWLAWKVSSRQGSQYVLSGGTPWTPDLPSDPTCQNPVTIIFSSTPTTPVPAGPFVFSAEGGTPVGAGVLNVSVPAAPVAGLANPSVKVSGGSFSSQKTVSWGSVWSLTDLQPGTYTISASPVNDGTHFYQAAVLSKDVKDKTTTIATLQYTAVSTGNVAVTLSGAPVTQQEIVFTGKSYQFTKTIVNGGSVVLPADAYTISASSPGYSVTALPNPLTVPQQTALTLTYKKASTSAAGFGGYYESWSSPWTADPARTEIARLAPYVTDLYLAFMRPDNTYQKGSLSFSGTGLDLNYQDGTVLKQAVALLHQKNPKAKVLISVGGATYNNWTQYNAKGVADFVSDFGLDGIDIDYEAANPGCSKGSDGLIRCQIDAAFQKIITSTRTLIPRPYLLTAATWSIAAYGQDKWANAQPAGDFTGMMLPFFRSAASADLDRVNVMSYDASNAYNPIEGLAAYRNYFKGGISMGIEVPPEAWGGHVYSLAEVKNLAQAVVSTATTTGTSPSMMMWSLQKKPNGTPSDTNPSAQMMASTVCTSLGLGSCSSPIFSP